MRYRQRIVFWIGVIVKNVNDDGAVFVDSKHVVVGLWSIVDFKNRDVGVARNGCCAVGDIVCEISRISHAVVVGWRIESQSFQLSFGQHHAVCNRSSIGQSHRTQSRQSGNGDCQRIRRVDIRWAGQSEHVVLRAFRHCNRCVINDWRIIQLNDLDQQRIKIRIVLAIVGLELDDAISRIGIIGQVFELDLFHCFDKVSLRNYVNIVCRQRQCDGSVCREWAGWNAAYRNSKCVDRGFVNVQSIANHAVCQSDCERLHIRVVHVSD